MKWVFRNTQRFELNATIKLAVQHVFDEGQEVLVRTDKVTYNTAISSDKLKHALKSMRIEAIILEMALYQSGLMIAKVSEIHVM